jgi:hypothetical protein
MFNTTLFLIVLSALFAGSLSAKAQETIKVDRVDFNSLRDDKLQVEIELSCEENPDSEARDKDFVEKIRVKAYLAFERDTQERSFDYYTSEVEIILMEKGDDKNVYFYLPGLIVERDQLKTDPDFYYIEVTVGEQVQEPQSTAMSGNIPNLDILKSFVSRADAEGGVNEHFLTPIYLMTGDPELGRVSDLPAFLRRDVRN